MKQLFLLLLSVTFLVSCGKDTSKVLLFITDGSRDLELMLTKEVIVMKEILEYRVLAGLYIALLRDQFHIE